ncbi:MAG TPA: galactosyltransferase-related protein [Povalibacter sp.]
MPVDYLLDPAELTRGQRWLRQWWPSSRLGTDPQQGLRVAGRYTPVSIANWKLIPAVARRLLALRVERPLTFAADQSLAVVIPYRDRQDHLAQLLPVLTATLREQQLRHRIIVVEQATAGPFNRGRLLNIGAHHAAPAADYYCLHDVDAVPIRANYLCPSQPLRLVTKIVTAGGESQRPDHYFSGAVSIRKEQMFAANGFSNEYWGWGKEDDDFFFRLLMTGLLCYFDLQGEFRDLPNPRHQQVRRRRFVAARSMRSNRRRRSRLLRGLETPAHDGLSNLDYQIVERFEHEDHEKICVRWPVMEERR